MHRLFVFRNEQGFYGLAPVRDVDRFPGEGGPWLFWKEIRFDEGKPLIGASKNSHEIKEIVDRDGFYIDGPDVEID